MVSTHMIKGYKVVLEGGRVDRKAKELELLERCDVASLVKEFEGPELLEYGHIVKKSGRYHVVWLPRTRKDMRWLME